MSKRINAATAAVAVAEAAVSEAAEQYRRLTDEYNRWAAQQPVGFVGKAVGAVPDTASAFGAEGTALRKLDEAKQNLRLAEAVTIDESRPSEELLADIYVLQGRDYRDVITKAATASAILTLAGRGQQR